jgi:hypothetical protein
VAHVLLTVELEPTDANFGSVKDWLSLNDDEVDETFGLVEVSPRRHLYTMLVDSDAAARVRGHDRVKRISSNPTVAAQSDHA